MEKHTILAFGAHADDVEIGMGASIAKWTAEGARVIICDLTKAELSSNGTVATRKKEAQDAAHLLGVDERMTLDIADRGLYINEENIRKVTTVIRKYKPTAVFCPYEKDRHPDHGNCAKLVEEAFFSAGIYKYQTEEREAHRPSNLFYYMINGFQRPSFVIDVSEHINKKINSLKAYKSQFYTNENGVQTPLTDGYIDTVIARERLFGKEIGKKYAEGFLTKKPVLLQLNNIIGEQP